MRRMMTWMMAAALFAAVAALPGCEAPDDPPDGGSGTRANTSDDGKDQQRSQDKDSPRQGSGYR